MPPLPLAAAPSDPQGRWTLNTEILNPPPPSLEFSTITKLDRDKTANWFRGYQKQMADK